MMDPCLYTFIDKLEAEHTLYASEWQQLLDGYTPRLAAYLFENHDARGFNSTDMMSISGDSLNLQTTAEITAITAGFEAETHTYTATG